MGKQQTEEYENGQKKTSVVKKVATGVFLPVLAPYYLVRWIVMDIIGIIKAIAKTARWLVSDTREKRARLKAGLEQQRTRQVVPIEDVLSGWGVEDEEDARQKLREFNFHLCVWSFLILIGLFVMSRTIDATSIGFGLAIVFFGLFGVLSTTWKRSVLKSRSFVYFTDWLRCK